MVDGLQLDGMASGMPTKDVIQQILNAQYGPRLQNLSEEKSTLKEQKNAWRDVNSRIDKLENKLTDLKLTSTFEANKTTSSDEDIAAATATNDAAQESYDLDVSQLAENHRLASKQITDPAADLDLNNDSGGSFEINGTTINVGADDSLQDIVDTINSEAQDADGNQFAEASIVNNTLVIESTETGTANQLSFTDTDGILEGLGVHHAASDQQSSSTNSLGLNGGNQTSFDINLADGTSMTIDVNDSGNNDSLQDIADAVNNDDENSGHVEAVISDNKLEIKSTNPSKAITSFTDNNTVLQDLGVLNSADGSDINYELSNQLQAAQDAQFSVNGLDITRSSNQDIDDVVDEVTFDLQDPGTATIEVSKDTEKATTAIQDFVDQYNSVQDFITTKLDYDQETEEAGALQGDGTLMRLQSNLRQQLTDSVFPSDGDPDTKEYNQLETVGITIDREGIMEFDSNKFEEALADKPEEVKQLFKGDTEEGDSFDGVATKLDSYLDMLVQTNTGVIPEKIDSYETMMDNVDDRVESTNDRLEQEKEKLQSEFTAMEKAISEMNSQMSWMQSQLGSMGSTSNMLSSMM